MLKVLVSSVSPFLGGNLKHVLDGGQLLHRTGVLCLDWLLLGLEFGTLWSGLFFANWLMLGLLTHMSNGEMLNL